MSDSESETQNINKRRGILTLIQNYKAMPCLWNIYDERYNSKEKRNKYFDILLQKYRVYKPKTDIYQLKKKIENLRSSYRRERKKVIHAQFSGYEHHPMLWYYKHMEFLDKIENDGLNEHVEDAKTEESVAESSKLESSEANKRRKTDVVYIKEERYDDESDDIIEQPNIQDTPAKSLNKTMNSEEPSSSSSTRSTETSAATFGRLVGIQLSELNRTQRLIAEKLIFDIMFLARMDKLTEDTQIKN